MTAANLIAGTAFVFDASAIGFVFSVLAGICAALTILHERLQP
jgi:hypothetical protein